MTPLKTEHLLIKYLSKESTASELDELEDWIKIPKNEILFRDYIKVHYAITLGMNNADPHNIKERLLREMRKDKNALRDRELRSIFRYAAIAILFTGMGYFFQLLPFGEAGNPGVIPKEEMVILEMGNGEIQKIPGRGSSKIVDLDGTVLGEQHGDKLIYKKTGDTKKIIYNTIKVPYGKKFDVFLSDGTHVFLNAGSSLKYPVSFLSGKPRKVFLEGEAYFDVAHNTTNPFIVDNQELNVKVYGTKFNVTNYASDDDIDVVLVEGSVALEAKEGESGDTEKLKPGFKGTFDKTKKSISIEKVDTSIYTSWMEGDLVFRNAPFATIIKRLERQYNVIIVNNNAPLGKEAFNATFETDSESLEQVLRYFNEIYKIDYQFYNNHVIIN